MLAKLSLHQRGNLAILFAMLTYVINDALVKLAIADYPVGQVIAVRGFFACFCTLALIAALRQGGAFRSIFVPTVLLRGGLDGAISLSFITALSMLPLGNATAIAQSSTLIIIALTALLGIDTVGWRRGLAVSIGFVGVLLVVKPSAGGFNMFALLALFSSALVAVRDLLTRNIAGKVPSGVIALSANFFVMSSGLIKIPFEHWGPMRLTDIGFLLLAAAFVSVGNLCMVVAYRCGDVAIVSALRYSALVFAILLGFLLWGDWPDALSALGAVLIIGTGVYVLHRQKLKGQLTEPPPV